MATQKIHYERRSRAEIDRNYFFGDVFIRTGAALLLALGAIALATGFSLRAALEGGMVTAAAMGVGFAFLGVGIILYGRHLRRSATHWDRED